MNTQELEKLKYPIGEFVKPKILDGLIINKWIKIITGFPHELENLTSGFSVEKLNWKYRPGGWSVKQLVHHCADSHMNSLIRFKLTLTEDSPKIRPYYEDRWAELCDSVDNDIEDSLTLIKSLHKKWVKLLKNLTDEELSLEFVHPEHGSRVALRENIGIYAWHSSHHLAHIKQALEFKGRFNKS